MRHAVAIEKSDKDISATSWTCVVTGPGAVEVTDALKTATPFHLDCLHYRGQPAKTQESVGE